MNDKKEGIEPDNDDGVRSIWNKSFILLILVSLITAMSFNMVYVVISKYALEVTSSLSIAGVIAGTFSIAALIIRPFAGATADTVNKKKLFIFANALITIALFGYTLSGNRSEEHTSELQSRGHLVCRLRL